MPSISIILPVYNVAPYLEACLDSLVAQTYQDFDVIAVNDGSQDGSLAILEAYQAKLPQLRIISQRNQGLSAARNTGLKHVTGKYLYFLDSDDYLQHDMLASCFALAEQEQLDMVKFDAEPFTEDGVMSINSYDSSAVLQEGKIYTQKEWLRAQCRHYNSPVWLFFVRAELVKMTFVDGLLHEDEIFTPQLFTKVKRVMYIRQTFFKRRYRKGSIMKNNIYYSRASYDSKKRVIRLLEKEKSMAKTSAAKRFLSQRRNILYMDSLSYDKALQVKITMHPFVRWPLAARVWIRKRRR
ncbi:glycosyltransferase [Listeria grandensis]|uniref:glycosyltransferase n=1 Tax=Listeria grandensis TaxID=1494963 RepID=UPI00164D0BA8|nr:glycosyltransferase [Listeria grandensis]MBC6315242.1 glycosyltransferase [Listeria grandensis]